jgi:hypothetical protein
MVNSLTIEEISARRKAPEVVEHVLFRVTAMYGLCREGVSLPLSTEESIDSGPICVTIDPDGDPAGNVGIIDFERRKLRVRYAVQLVFPGLHDLVLGGQHDLALLNPPRAVATDDCTVTGDYTGWHAKGCVDFLPGSLWAGAGGG